MKEMKPFFYLILNNLNEKIYHRISFNLVDTRINQTLRIRNFQFLMNRMDTSFLKLI